MATKAAGQARKGICRRRLKEMRAETGFTLIEVMIVVAIIGILCAVAIPFYMRHVQRARVVSLIYPGLHAIETNIALYYATNRDLPPPRRRSVRFSGRGRHQPLSGRDGDRPAQTDRRFHRQAERLKRHGHVRQAQHRQFENRPLAHERHPGRTPGDRQRVGPPGYDTSPTRPNNSKILVSPSRSGSSRVCRRLMVARQVAWSMMMLLGTGRVYSCSSKTLLTGSPITV